MKLKAFPEVGLDQFHLIINKENKIHARISGQNLFSESDYNFSKNFSLKFFERFYIYRSSVVFITKTSTIKKIYV